MLAKLIALMVTVQPVAQVEVVTFDGNVYVVGQGDDCRAAYKNIRLPDDWRSIECVQRNLITF